MSLITPFIPTAEDIALFEQHRSRSQTSGQSQSPSQSESQPHAETHTSTSSGGSPGDLPILNAMPGAPPSSSKLPAYQPLPYHGHAPASPQHAGQQRQAWAQTPPAQPKPPLDAFVLTAAQLEDLVIPRKPALLDRWLCEGDLGYIFAPRGVGKTWMAMALPSAISRGLPLGLWSAGDAIATPAESSTTTPGSEISDSGLDPATAPASGFVPILYVDGEMSLNLTQYRSHALQMRHSGVCYMHHEHLHELDKSSLNIGDPEDRHRITDLLTRQGYKVLILDNLSSLASGVDENKGMDYEPLANWLLDLRRKKITVIVVHHAGRSGLMRGHSKREDACSWILELRDARQDGDPGAKFVSHFAKPSRNTGDPLPDLLWHFTSDKVTNITDIRCEVAIENDYDQFIQHVIDGVTSQADIAELMNKPKGTVSKWAAKALHEKRIRGSTRQMLPPHSDQASRSRHEPDDTHENWADEFTDGD
jgi:hypothetical protein